MNNVRARKILPTEQNSGYAIHTIKRLAFESYMSSERGTKRAFEQLWKDAFCFYLKFSELAKKPLDEARKGVRKRGRG